MRVCTHTHTHTNTHRKEGGERFGGSWWKQTWVLCVSLFCFRWKLRKRLNFTCKSLLHVAHRGVSENSLESRDKREDVSLLQFAGILGRALDSCGTGGTEAGQAGQGPGTGSSGQGGNRSKLDVLLIYSFILRWF